MHYQKHYHLLEKRDFKEIAEICKTHLSKITMRTKKEKNSSEKEAIPLHYSLPCQKHLSLEWKTGFQSGSVSHFKKKLVIEHICDVKF